MRIAHTYAGSVPIFGSKGEAIQFQEISRALVRRGTEIDLLAKRFGGAPPAGLEQARTHRLPGTPGRTRADRNRAALAANEALRARLSGLGPLDVFLERYSLWSYAGVEHAREVGVPALLLVDGPRIEEADARGNLEDRALAERVAARAVAAATAIVVVSPGVARYVEREFDAGARVHVVPNGVDPDRYPDHLLEQRAGDERPFTVGYVGAFREYHGVSTLVEAFGLLRRSHPQARLLLVGDGPERPVIEGRIEALGLGDSVTIAGAVAHDDVPAELGRVDVGVAPYAAGWDYLSPLKVLEYLAAGLPVVASGVEELTGMLGDGTAGLVCRPGDPTSLAEALGLLASDPALRARLGAAGRAHVLERYTWDGFAGRILELAGVS